MWKPDPVKVAAYYKGWYAKNRKRVIAKMAARAARLKRAKVCVTCRGKLSARSRLYCPKHRRWYLEFAHAWARAHPKEVRARKRRQRQRQQAAGLCMCGRKARKGKQTCGPCIARNVVVALRRRRRRRRAGLCACCGAPRVAGSSYFCARHLRANAAKARQLTHARHQQGLCYHCARKPVPGHTMCEKHLQKLRDQYWQRKRRAA